MRRYLNHWTIQSALCLGISAALSVSALGQAAVTAQRGAEIAPFVLSSMTSPDWGQTRDLGFTAGVDYTRYIRSIVQPSLEVRFNSVSGSTVNERSFTGGLKIATTIHGVHPYATLLAGNGTISFMHPVGNYLSDISFVYSMGGGADFNVHSNWRVRADFVQQNWNLDPHQLTPVAMSVGVTYRIPFRGGGWEH